MIDDSRPATSDGLNPYAPSPYALNPDAPGRTASEASAVFSSLSLPAWIALGCCVASLCFLLLTLIVSLPYGSPNAPPLIGIISFIGVFMVLSALGIAGAVSMLRRRHYGLCVVAAFGLMVPLLGPCFGLTLPLGIWAIVLLRHQSIRESFVAIARPQGDYDNADDAIAAASTLDRKGDWDAAVELYRVAADRWPEHAKYADNCIQEIAKKQALASDPVAN